MARTFLTPIDMGRLEVRNLRIQQLASAPAAPVEGLIYWNTTDHNFYAYSGSAWVNCSEQNIVLDYAEANDMVASAPGDTASAGSSDEIARGDHRHARTDGYGTSAQATTVGGSSAAGSSGNVSRADHTHGLSGGTVTAQTSFGASSADGSASTAARSDHAHGTPSHTDHTTLSLSTFTAPTGSVSFGSQRLTSLAEPVSDSDGATKGYVDNAVAGLSWKDSVRVATTTSGTLATSFENGDVIDGVTLATGDRILIKDQSGANEKDNGIYIVAASGAPSRAGDANTSAELRGAAVFVEEGTANAGKQFVVTSDGFTLGTDAIAWGQFGAPIVYTAGDGLTLTSTEFAVGAGTGITVTADAVAIDTTVVARKSATTLDTSSTTYTVTHNLGTRDVHVTVYDTSSYATVECDVTNATTNTVTIGFASAPSANAYRVVVVG